MCDYLHIKVTISADSKCHLFPLITRFFFFGQNLTVIYHLSQYNHILHKGNEKYQTLDHVSVIGSQVM